MLIISILKFDCMYLIRLLRIVGVLIATIIPGLCVALVSVNPEVLRLQLALSIANSRQDVPYPAFVETLLLLIVLELILEYSTSKKRGTHDYDGSRYYTWPSSR
ncbi:hypothetical protein AK95_16055 [Paenibacillus sp. LC231]|uniref:spore germination protein n=1 Tax=Paenibacillus sp. LC231 TaxID=1120679 RepID=UPI0008DD4EFE|nr:spore germination protein [Paenibacillus sp. LC231]OIA98675.1 hypothetical protein AK95_16055 [Paenibacillus sp. LC231]